MKEKQLFFDLDRTLWDFEANSKKALIHLFETTRLKNHCEHFLQFHFHYVNINNDLWKAYGKGKISKEELRISRFSKSLEKLAIDDTSLVHELAEKYLAISPFQTQCFPNAHQLLDCLKGENYRMHIITNGFKEVQFIKLRESKLIDYFDMILCSEEIGVNKPHKAIFEHALKTTNCLAENAVMIGDDFQVDIQGALQAGWHAVHFDPEKRMKVLGNVPRIRDLIELEEVLLFGLR